VIRVLLLRARAAAVGRGGHGRIAGTVDLDLPDVRVASVLVHAQNRDPNKVGLDEIGPLLPRIAPPLLPQLPKPALFVAFSIAVVVVVVIVVVVIIIVIVIELFVLI